MRNRKKFILSAIVMTGALFSSVFYASPVRGNNFDFAEVTGNLVEIWMLQQAYFAEFGQYVAMDWQGREAALVTCSDNELTFDLNLCDASQAYGFRVTVVAPDRFVIVAASGTGENNLVIENCPYPDVWLMDQTGFIQHNDFAFKYCP